MFVLDIPDKARRVFLLSKQLLFRRPVVSALAFAAIFVAILPKVTLLLIWLFLFLAGVSIALPVILFRAGLLNNAVLPCIALIGVYAVAIRRGWRLGRLQTHVKVLAWTILVVAPVLYLLRMPLLDTVDRVAVIGAYHVAAVRLLPMFTICAVAGWGAWQLVLAALHRTGRRLTPESERLGLFFAALLAIALPTTLLPAVVNREIVRSAHQLIEADRDHAPFAALPSTVLLKMPPMPVGSGLQCERLCLRLLYNRATDRVIVMRNDEQRRPGTRKVLAVEYRIERRDVCPQPEISKTEIVWANNGAHKRLLREGVLERIARGECLVRYRANPQDAPMTIVIEERYSRSLGDRDKWRYFVEPEILRRLTVLEGEEVSFRRTVVAAWKISLPLGFARTGLFRDVQEFGEMGIYGRDILPELFGRAVGPVEPS